MKALRLLVLFSVAMFLLTANSYAQNKDGKMGYVDISRLFDSYYKTKEYDEVLNGKHTSFQEEVKNKVEEIKEKESKLVLLADDKKAGLETEIETMRTNLLEFDRQKKTDLTKERNEKIQELLLEIEHIISNFAEKENYSVILNDRVLIYGNPDLELTEKILKILNENEAK
ncbi:MAG: OmpH family outer membrane protein [Candidatus Omnitrophica bacterium]|nr:OmpH family outer membrane protein [Candidatus Omnitrophota bacterium]MBU1995539.1 OmpH family outer membrane protein [Candidatus Omnitrophota bacterium]MBU4334382.1 OmpH family outer membrane protein [Candidatus Omnitrophota bacterium]